MYIKELRFDLTRFFFIITAEDLEITLVMPEETLVLTAGNHEQKNEWIVGLQKCVIDTLGVGSGSGSDKKHTPPILRNTTYNFTKFPELKGAKYEGAWLHGKIHGQGKLSWTDGRFYEGQLKQNQKHGIGKMNVPGVALYEGKWKSDKFEGRGKIFYASGDHYFGQVCIF